jgi:hypothetical protein
MTITTDENNHTKIVFSGCLKYGYGIGRGALLKGLQNATNLADCYSMCQQCNFVTWNGQNCFMKTDVPYVCKHTKDTVSLDIDCLKKEKEKKSLDEQKKRLAEVEVAELEKKRLAKLERERLAEVESDRLAEVEVAELEKKRLAKLERERLAEVEAAAETKAGASSATKTWIFVSIGCILVVGTIIGIAVFSRRQQLNNAFYNLIPLTIITHLSNLTPLLSQTRRLELTSFPTQVKAGVIPEQDEYQCLNEVDSRLHVMRFNTNIGSQQSRAPQGSLNRYK